MLGAPRRHRLCRRARAEGKARVNVSCCRPRPLSPSAARCSRCRSPYLNIALEGMFEMPGPREGGGLGPRFKPSTSSARDSITGRACGAGGLLLQGLLAATRYQRRAGLVRRSVGQLRNSSRATWQADGADSPPHPRDQRERRARRVLPTGRYRPRKARKPIAFEPFHVLSRPPLRAFPLGHGGPGRREVADP